MVDFYAGQFPIGNVQVWSLPADSGPLITDWLMVIITVVYVVATIAICWANIRSASASKDQLAEMKRQYEDDKRMKLMPCFQVKLCSGRTHADAVLCYKFYDEKSCPEDISTSYYLFQVQNVGHDVAKNVVQKFRECTSNYSSYESATIAANDCVNISFDFKAEKFDIAAWRDEHLAIEISYEDLVGNRYSQEFALNVRLNTFGVKIQSYDISAPELK